MYYKKCILDFVKKLLLCFLGAFLAYGISSVDFPWRRHGNWILCLNTGILSILVFLSANSNSLVFIYSAYVIFNGIFQAMLTIAQ